jgi:hypothetical protein
MGLLLSDFPTHQAFARGIFKLLLEEDNLTHVSFFVML